MTRAQEPRRMHQKSERECTKQDGLEVIPSEQLDTIQIRTIPCNEMAITAIKHGVRLMAEVYKLERERIIVKLKLIWCEEHESQFTGRAR